jgi:chromosome segregation ATPase
MGTSLRRLHSLELELDPVASFEMMNTPIEGQQKFERVVERIIRHIISCHDMNSQRRAYPTKAKAASAVTPGGPLSPQHALGGLFFEIRHSPKWHLLQAIESIMFLSV